ncbi:hypothetical protein [Streptomyces fodineus]|uniref:hypothetical protein n=1 Tax=Streptomyces fodineus TaxID=1904616 RepID=UPI0013EA9330|nr:hypothetical protein [Streptomyces fodineus]
MHLGELNGLFTAWGETVYHRTAASPSGTVRGRVVAEGAVGHAARGGDRQVRLGER